LGAGFLEKVYENTLAIELRKADLEVEQQKKINVKCEGDVVGDYIADFVVNKSVLLEIKATKSIDKVHQAQLLNYLKATGLRVGLVLNFGASRLGIKRVVL
jgi:GxxExxY protein